VALHQAGIYPNGSDPTPTLTPKLTSIISQTSKGAKLPPVANSPGQSSDKIPDFDSAEIDDPPDGKQHVPLLDPFDRLKPTPRLTADMLPSVLWDFINDTSERMSVDPALVLMPVLSTLAAVIDDAIQIQPKAYDTTWTESARIWALTVAPPGSKKTPTMNQALAPLRDIETAWAAADKELLRHYARQSEMHEQSIRRFKAAIRNGEAAEYPEEPERPPNRQIIVTDTTFEAMASEIMLDNPRGILWVADELTGLLGSLDTYHQKGGSKDRAILLQAWNGGCYTINRKGSRINVPNLSASVIGGVQDNKLSELASKLSTDGLLQRFLVVQVENSNLPAVDRAPNYMALEAYRTLVHNLSNLQSPGQPVTLSNGAQVLRHTVETLTRALVNYPGLPSAMKNHADKLDGLFARVLLLLHCASYQAAWNDLATQSPLPLVVSEATAEQAYFLMVEFFIPHAIRIYTGHFSDPGSNDAQWIAGYLLSHGCDYIDERTLYRANHRAFDDRSRLRTALTYLEDIHWVIRMGTDSSNRRYEVNRDIHTQFVDRAKSEKARRESVKDKIGDSQNLLSSTYCE
jgi:hypothetical protein